MASPLVLFQGILSLSAIAGGLLAEAAGPRPTTRSPPGPTTTYHGPPLSGPYTHHLNLTTVEIYTHLHLPADDCPTCGANGRELWPNSTRTLSYFVVDGMAIIDGDIIFGTEAELLASTVEASTPNLSSGGKQAPQLQVRTVSDFQWPGGTVQYKWAAGLSDRTKKIFLAASDLWMQRLPFLDFQMAPDSTVARTIREATMSVSSSGLGCCGGMLILGAGATVATAAHEIGHTLGLVHEHTRPDRDQYVNVNCDEISSPKTCGPDPSRWSGVARQFSVMPLPSWDVPGPYDVDSIMHYDAFAFAKGRTPVITGRPGVVFKDSGRNSPTALDARRICETYRTLCDSVCDLAGAEKLDADDMFKAPRHGVENDRAILRQSPSQCVEIRRAPQCLPTCQPVALPPDAAACAYGEGRATCEAVPPASDAEGPAAAAERKTYCFCQAGYRAMNVEPQTTHLQYRMVWHTEHGVQTHRVAVAPGQACGTLCTDSTCDEVPLRGDCR